jgi:hypothetical protein
LKVGLGVDGSAEVVVEVSAFGHVVEERAKAERVGAELFEPARGARFRGLREECGGAEEKEC